MVGHIKVLAVIDQKPQQFYAGDVQRHRYGLISAGKKTLIKCTIVTTDDESHMTSIPNAVVNAGYGQEFSIFSGNSVGHFRAAAYRKASWVFSVS